MNIPATIPPNRLIGCMLLLLLRQGQGGDRRRRGRVESTGP